MDTETHRKLMAQAGRLLGRRAYSRGDLANRLARGADPAAVETVVGRLEQLGLLNDLDYAYNLSLQRLTREGWGVRRVRGELIARGVAPEIIEAALARVFEDTDEEVALAGYVERHAAKRGRPGERQAIHRLVKHLERRGFPSELIYRVLRRTVDPSAWQRFEDLD